MTATAKPGAEPLGSGSDVGSDERSGDADEVVSDAMLERLFRWLLIGLAAAVLAAGLAGVGLWGGECERSAAGEDERGRCRVLAGHDRSP